MHKPKKPRFQTTPIIKVLNCPTLLKNNEWRMRGDPRAVLLHHKIGNIHLCENNNRTRNGGLNAHLLVKHPKARPRL